MNEHVQAMHRADGKFRRNNREEIDVLLIDDAHFRDDTGAAWRLRCRRSSLSRCNGERIAPALQSEAPDAFPLTDC